MVLQNRDQMRLTEREREYILMIMDNFFKKNENIMLVRDKIS